MATFRYLAVVVLFVALVEGYKPGDKQKGDDDFKKPDKGGCKSWPCKDREWPSKPDDGRKADGEDKYDKGGCRSWPCKDREWPGKPDDKRWPCNGRWCKYWSWFNKPRDVELWIVKENMVKLKASQKTETYSDYLDFQIKAGTYDGVDTNFKYHLKPKGESERVKFDMTMKLFKIIEFKDAPGSAAGYDSGDDVVQEYVLGSPRGGRRRKQRGEVWSPIKEVIDPEHPDARTFSAKTKDGVFEVIGRYAGQPVNFTRRFDGNGSADVTYEYHLMPNNIKFDYIIRDFPFMAKDSTLALEGRFKSYAGVKQYRSRKFALGTPTDDGDNAIHGMFTWASTVHVDGVETPVLASFNETTTDDDDEEASKLDPNEKRTKSVWTFAHSGPASLFVWDPTLGVESAESDNPNDNASNSDSDDGNMLSGANGFAMCFLPFLPVWALRLIF